MFAKPVTAGPRRVPAPAPLLPNTAGAGREAQITLGSRVQVTQPDGSGFESTGKAALLLAMAALEESVERRRVAILLWPDSPESQARNNLRTLVHRVNQRCGGELVAGADQLTLSGAQVQLLHQGEEVLAALEAGGAARCELLGQAGVEGEGGQALQAWLAQARQRLRRRQLAGLGEALAAALAQAHHTRAAALAQACVQLEPLSESGHRRLMDVLARSGDRASALAAYEACKALLRKELGVLPDLLTRTVQLRILQDQAMSPDVQAPAPQAGALTPLGGAAKYPLVERAAVLHEAQQTLARGVHVLLQGEPGVGKTRVLRQLAVGTDVEQVAVRAGARGEAYAALAQLLQELQPRRGARIGVPEQVELARLAPLAFAGVKPSQAPLSAPRLHAAVRHWVAALGEAGVRLLVIDDVHDADTASQAALGALLQGSGDAPADAQTNAQTNAQTAAPALLLAYRGGEIDALLEDALVAAQVRHRARRIELPRLTLAGVQALLQAMALPQALGRQLLQRTGGNPLFVIELAQAGTAADTADLQLLLKVRLAGCSVAAQQLAAVAAVASEEFSVELAAAVTGHSPLALMPAWVELQQRGLFADHGLAHDLIRDAVLARLPRPILLQLHRQVARHLESQGLQGAVVLKHWLAADDADHALPHAVHQFDAGEAAGLGVRLLAMAPFGLLERASDAVLLDNLWLSARIAEEDATGEWWRRLEGLLARVRALSNSTPVRCWVAYETARIQHGRDRNPRLAYDTALPWSEQLPEQGDTRAELEYFLALLAFSFRGPARRHAERFYRALVGSLADSPRWRMKARVAQFLVKPMNAAIRVEATAMRTAMRRGDLGYRVLARDAIGTALLVHGYTVSASRHFEMQAQAAQAPIVADERSSINSSTLSQSWAIGALAGGRYQAVIGYLKSVRSTWFEVARVVLLAVAQLRLGRHTQSRELLESLKIEQLALGRYLPLLAVHSLVLLDMADGRDPLPGLRKVIDGVRAAGASPIVLRLLEWEVESRTLGLDARLAASRGLLQEFRQDAMQIGHLALVLLNTAETQAEAHDPAARPLALEAARLLRRRCSFTLYFPEAMLRCASLLEHSDPAEASSLVHVARRWVVQALPHVPAEALQSFVYQVPANLQLLGPDAAAAAEGQWS